MAEHCPSGIAQRDAQVTFDSPLDQRPVVWNDFQVECPTGSGRRMNLAQVAHEISERLGRLFQVDSRGVCPWQGPERRFIGDPNWRGMVWFYEYFHGDTGRGLGANHQTGWTALIARLFDKCARQRQHHMAPAARGALTVPLA